MPRGYYRAVELRHLRYFTAVAADLNFTEAARKLRVAQPALSRQIRQLEDELGVSLFERQRRRIALTAPGRAFLREALVILRQSAQAVENARRSGRRPNGQLRVGYVWGLFHTVAPRSLAQFRAQLPDVAVHLFDLNAISQARALLEGRIDAGFIGFECEADKVGLAKRKIGDCEFYLAMPSNHRAARLETVDLSSMSTELFVLISEDAYPGASLFVANACEAAGFKPKSLQTAERGHTILGLVAAGCGIALLPSPLRDLPHPNVVFRPLSAPCKADLQIAWNPRRVSPLLEAFLGSLGRSVPLIAPSAC